jgi:hypothetical protein
LFVEPANLRVTNRCVKRLFGTDLRRKAWPFIGLILGRSA